MSIEGEDVQATGKHNMFNKVITDNLLKVLPIQVQEAFRSPTDLTKIEPPCCTLSFKKQAQRTVKEY
jgi:hypothetical protein